MYEEDILCANSCMSPYRKIKNQARPFKCFHVEVIRRKCTEQIKIKTATTCDICGLIFNFFVTFCCKSFTKGLFQEDCTCF